MLGHNAFYGECLKNLVSAFGTLFNDITIIRSGTTTQTVNVPLTYASRDKAYIRRTQDPDTNFNMKMQFPRLAFQMVGMQYDATRKINLSQPIAHATLNTKTFHPIPYNVEFELYLATASIEDGLQIIEQILPFFAPEYTVAMKSYSGIDLLKDIPIVLNSVTPQDNTADSEFEDFRVLEWTLSFTAKAWIGGPSNSTGKRIKEVRIFAFDDNAMNQLPEIVVGVAVNPSTAKSNEVHTVDVTLTEIEAGTVVTA